VLRDQPIRRDRADLARLRLAEPQVAVGSGGDARGPRVGGRDRELVDRLGGRRRGERRHHGRREGENGEAASHVVRLSTHGCAAGARGCACPRPEPQAPGVGVGGGAPPTATRPTRLPWSSLNQTFPSGPEVTPTGAAAEVGIPNSVTCPW